MAKELGQIHTVNSSLVVTASGDVKTIDVAGHLTQQLQRMVRQGNFFKTVGIDMTLDLGGGATGGQVSGYVRYYSPTKGRCDAYRGAFKAMKDVMKVQGINTMTNPLYDFRCNFNDSDPIGFPNQATLDGTTGLVLHSVASPRASVFGIHNESVTPVFGGAAADLYSEGFDTILQSGALATDFVLNDTPAFTGNTNEASTAHEYIPFSLSWEPGAQTGPVTLEWRPDPALYLAVMCGLFQVVVEEAAITGPGNLNVNIAVMISGWKSIMSERRHRSKSSKKLTADKKSSSKTSSKK